MTRATTLIKIQMAHVRELVVRFVLEHLTFFFFFFLSSERVIGVCRLSFSFIISSRFLIL